MSDYKALFKAAKAQRTATPAKLSKDQLRALKAQKAAAAAAEAEEAARRKAQEDAAKAAAAAAPPAPTPRAKPAASGGSSRALAPPPMFAAPRPGAPVQAAPAASYHADSQATQVGQARVSLERLQSDASTTGGGRATRPAAHSNGVPAPAALPPGFFESGAAAPEDASPAAAGPSSSGASGAPPGTAEPSLPSASSIVTTRVEGALPADFFQDGGAEEESLPEQDLQPREGPGAAAPAAEPAEAGASTSALPKGFFENKEADAKARGEAPPKKQTAAEAFSDFMASVSSDVRQVEAREEEEAADAAVDRAERDAFEQRLRRQRLEDLKHGGGGAVTAVSIAAQLPSAAEEVVLDTASIAVEAEQFAPRKRRRSGALEPDLADDEGEGEDEEEEEDDEDLMLDWRAKRL